MKEVAADKHTVLTHKTLVPLGIVVALFIAAMWLATLYVTSNANAADIEKIKAQQREDYSTLEQKIDRMNEKFDHLIELLAF